MPYPIYINKGQNPFLMQGMNLLTTLALQKIGANLREKELETARENAEFQYDREMDLKLKLDGFMPATPPQKEEGDAAPDPNYVDFNGRWYKKTEPKIGFQQFNAGGKTFGYATKNGEIHGNVFDLTPDKDMLSDVGKLWQDYNNLPEGSPARQWIKGRIDKLNRDPSETPEVVYGPDGSVIFARGVDPTKISGLTRGTQSKFEEEAFNVETSIDRLEDIISQYDPKFQHIQDRFAHYKNSWKLKLGMKVDEKDEAALREFSEYRKTAVSMMNEEINRLGGAAVSKQEEARLKAGMPNPGKGVFDGDDPATLESSLKAKYKDLQRIKWRYHYYMNKGYTESQIRGLMTSGKQVGLNQIDDIINQRAQELESVLMTQGLSRDEVRAKVKSVLRKEFGMQ